MTAMVYRVMIDCRMAPPNLTEEQIIQRAKADVVRHIAEHVAGQIRDLKLQPQFTIQEAYTTPEGQRVRAIRYQADFSYKRPTEPDCTGEVHWLRVVEDVKSRATKTRVYEIKKKLMREKLGIEIQEV